jgi:serine dehydrogenase proteinase
VPEPAAGSAAGTLPGTGARYGHNGAGGPANAAPAWLTRLQEWQQRRGRPAVVVSAPIDDDLVPVLYECLRTVGRVERMDLVLATVGGTVTVARRVAVLLGEFTAALTIVVPHQARSAGTLLCLGAHELLLGPMAELSPIDPNLSATWPPPPDGTDRLSAEDVRAFVRMAGDWFGVTRDADRLQVLALVAQRIFPGSLAALYRYDRLCRRSAHELLRRQLPDAGDAARERIVDQLVSGYDAHDHVITRADAVALGLRVAPAAADLDELAWQLLAAHRRELVDRPGEPGTEGATGLVTSERFCARRMQRWKPSVPYPDARPGAQAPMTPRVQWEVDRFDTATGPPGPGGGGAEEG